MNESQVFADALRLATPTERAAYLDAACAGEPGLRAAVDDLLRVHAADPDFLEVPPDCPTETAGWTPTPGPPAEPGSAEQPGAVLAGRYKLLEPLGAGGMGTVWLAQQTDPVRRLVAVKLIRPGMDSRQVLARFEQERQALAQMDHPNIARVLDGGATPDGRPFLAMELVKGVPITGYCDDGQLGLRARLLLFADVCHAVQHAHQKGVIHRDLKPSNVLVAPYDGRPVVKVIDFGVAKAAGQPLTDRTLFTRVGAVVGTPEYMSPEQAELNNRDVDTRSDVYSLGVLLYELLTGTTPLTPLRVRETALLEVLRVIREEEPPRPSARLSESKALLPAVSARRATDPAKLARLVRGELDWIVMKAIDKDRDRRYETASALAADVQRYLDDEPVQACPPSVWYRARKLARRNRRALVTASVLTVAALVGVGGLAVSTALVWKANKELKEAVYRERREAYFQRITVAHRELSIDNLAAALRALGDCPEDLRGWEWYYLSWLCKVEPLVLRDKAEVNGVAFSPDPDGERLASAGGDGTVKVWNSRTGQVIRVLEKAHTGSVLSVAFHPDGGHLASRGADQQVKVWSLTTGREVFSCPCDAIRKFGSAYTVAFSPDGRQLATGSDGTVTVWDWKNRRVLHTLPGHGRNAISVAFSPDGRLLASGCTGEGVMLWDARSGGLLRTIPADRHPVSALAFSPDGGQLASASLGRTVMVWDVATGELRHTLPHTGTVECVAFSPDGSRLVSSGEDKTVRIWDVTTGREALGLRGHAGRCGCVAFSADGRRLASASADCTIRVWDATPLRGNEGQEVFTFARHDDEIRSVVFSPDGRRVASAGRSPPVKVWTAATGEPAVELDGRTNVVFCLAWQPNGERIASAGWDGRRHTVQVWDARTGREAFSIPPEQDNFTAAYFAVAFSPDPGGRYLVTGEGSGAAQVWDARTGQPVGTLGKHRRGIRGVVFSPKGGHLASASADGEVKLWDATRLDQQQEPRLVLPTRVPGPGLNVAFSPDGRRLATGGEENTVKVWDVQTGRELQTLRGHNGEVYTVAFSPDGDGRWVASAGEDSAVKVWDTRTGKVVRNFRGHTALVSSVAFSPDGRRLISGSRDHKVKVWDVTQLDKTPDR